LCIIWWFVPNPLPLQSEIANKKREMRKQTTAINTPFVRPDVYGALAVPIYNNVSFEFKDAQEMSDAFCNRIKAPDYARIANPTVTQFEQRVKALTGADHVTAFNSGMAAISTALLAVVAQGKNIVTSRHLFGNTLALISGTLLRLGVKPRLRNLTNGLYADSWTGDARCALPATCCQHLAIGERPVRDSCHPSRQLHRSAR
jgi:O-acetylhomoserine (thiol)-lyase